MTKTLDRGSCLCENGDVGITCAKLWRKNTQELKTQN